MLAALAAGWGCRRRGLFQGTTAESLNALVLWICLPALILARVPGLVLRTELLALALTPWLLAALVAGSVLLLGRWLGWSRSVVGNLLLMCVLSNTAFVGYPLIEALRGPEILPVAAVYDQFGNFMLTASYGVLIAASFSGQQRPALTTILRRIVSFPPFIALIVALLLPGPLPDTWLRLAEWLALPLLPMVAFALGLNLRLVLPADQRQPLLIGLALKLVLMPVFAWLILGGLPIGSELVIAGVLQAAMPPMFTAAALAIGARLEPELAAAMVGYGLVIGLVTVMAWNYLLPT